MCVQLTRVYYIYYRDKLTHTRARWRFRDVPIVWKEGNNIGDADNRGGYGIVCNIRYQMINHK